MNQEASLAHCYHLQVHSGNKANEPIQNQPTIRNAVTPPEHCGPSSSLHTYRLTMATCGAERQYTAVTACKQYTDVLKMVDAFLRVCKGIGYTAVQSLSGWGPSMACPAALYVRNRSCITLFTTLPSFVRRILLGRSDNLQTVSSWTAKRFAKGPGPVTVLDSDKVRSMRSVTALAALSVLVLASATSAAAEEVGCSLSS